MILNFSHLPKPSIIAISGFGGAGKSTLARQIAATFNTEPISVDAFFKNHTDEDYSLWEIVDFDRIENEIIKPFLTEKNPEKILIIEGVGLFRPNLMPYFNHTIWIDCPIDEAIKRGKHRDRHENNYPQDEKWDGVWRRNDLEYFNTYHPKEKAHQIIPLSFI